VRAITNSLHPAGPFFKNGRVTSYTVTMHLFIFAIFDALSICLGISRTLFVANRGKADREVTTTCFRVSAKFRSAVSRYLIVVRAQKHPLRLLQCSSAVLCPVHVVWDPSVFILPDVHFLVQPTSIPRSRANRKTQTDGPQRSRLCSWFGWHITVYSSYYRHTRCESKG
jgi:hypothetical protein